jgi:hypothetical protein
MRSRSRYLVILLLCLASAFGGPIASSYAGEEACTSQMADHGDTPVTPDCDSCDSAPAGHMQQDCCFVAGGAGITASATPSAPVSTLGLRFGSAPLGYRSVASSPGFQPPR